MPVRGYYPIPAEYGDLVLFLRHDGISHFHGPPKLIEAGIGHFTLAWLGIEETWEVEVAPGKKVNLYPYAGDTMVRVA